MLSSEELAILAHLARRLCRLEACCAGQRAPRVEHPAIVSFDMKIQKIETYFQRRRGRKTAGKLITRDGCV